MGCINCKHLSRYSTLGIQFTPPTPVISTNQTAIQKLFIQIAETVAAKIESWSIRMQCSPLRSLLQRLRMINFSLSASLLTILWRQKSSVLTKEKEYGWVFFYHSWIFFLFVFMFHGTVCGYDGVCSACVYRCMFVC